MNAGPKYEYLWADGTTIKKPISCSAPRYVDYLFTWVQNLLDDERIFPTEIGTPFPPDFLDYIRNIFKRLFRVYAHIYYCHFERMGQLGAEPHLNTCFKHYMYFVYEFNLIPKKEEPAPLQAPGCGRLDPNPNPNPNPNATPRPSQDLIDKLMADDAHRFGGGASVPGGRDAAASAVGASATDGEQTARSHSHTPASPQ